MSQPHVLLLGAPGAGKGTQSANIVEAFGVDHITTGDALRANKDMDIGDMGFEYDRPREYMEAGELVPDAVVNEIVAEALESADGYVLDGYPRNVDQARFLADATDLDAVVYLQVPEDELLDRLTGRRVCQNCGANYHVKYAPPEEPGVCDECGGELVQRDDDTEETARERLAVFRENTLPVVDFYRDREAFAEVDGDQPPDEVWTDLREVIEQRT